MVVAFGVIVVLAVALLLVSRSDREVAATEASPFPAAPPTSTAPPTASPDESQILPHAAEALSAWGLFAATGDLDEVYATFAPGPQLDQLEAEAPDRSASAPGLPAFEFTMSDSAVVTSDATSATVRTSIRMTRSGSEPADFRWELVMRWDEPRRRWMLYTVSTIEE